MKKDTMTRKIVKTGASLLMALALAASGILAAAPANAGDTASMTATFKQTDFSTQNMEFHIYKVGTVVNGVFKLDPPYSASGIKTDFTKETDSKDMMDSAATLYSYIKTHDLDSEYEQKNNPDANGNMSFSVEKRVLYLLASDSKETVGNTTYWAQPSYMWYIEGGKNKLTVKPDSETKLPPTPVDYTVVKHWSGDTAKTRPESIEIDLYEDEKHKETVTLDSDNDWTYTWTDKDGKGEWTCYEKNVPKGYKVSLKEAENGTKLIVTNTKQNKPTPPSKVRTGDPTTMRWSIIAMAVSGIVLLIAGLRRRREEQ